MNAPRTSAAPRRRRRGLLWALLLPLAALLALALMLAWVLRSAGGRDFALARVLAALPADALQWRSADGVLDGPLVLHDVRFRHSGYLVEFARVRFDFAPRALLGRELHVEALTLERGRIVLPESAAEAEPWPERFALPQLPALEAPLALRVDAFALREVTIERGPLRLLALQQVDAVGSFARGRIALERLEVVSDRGRLSAQGALDTAQRWRTGLQARVDPAAPGTPPLPLAIVADGDAQRLRLVVTGDVPAPMRLEVTLAGGVAAPGWTLSLDAPELDPRRFGYDAEPLGLALQGDGTLDVARLTGSLRVGARTLAIERAELQYDAGVIRLQPLALTLDGARVQLAGAVDLRPAQPQLALQADVDGWPLVDGDPTQAVSASGRAKIAGPLADYALDVDATLDRGTQQARIVAAGRGDREQLSLTRAELVLPGGTLRAQGRVGWAPEPHWDLQATAAGFDPSWLAAEFPGAVDAELVARGRVTDAGVDGTLRIDPLGGRLRGRALGGRIDVTLRDGGADGELQLRLGDSRVDARGRYGATHDLRVQLAPLQLADLLPDAGGSLRGELTLSGTPAAPRLQATLDGERLAYADVALGAVRVRAQLADDVASTLEVDARDLATAGVAFDALTLRGDGTRERHALSLALAADAFGLDATLAGSLDDAQWRGTLQSLRLQPRAQPAWTLRSPSALQFARDGTRLGLAPSCIESGAASACVDVERGPAATTGSVLLQRLPLALVEPWLAPHFDVPVSAHGTLSGGARLARGDDGAMRGTLRIDATAGGLRLGPDSPRELLAWRSFEVRGALDPQQATLQGELQIGDDGRLQAQLTTQSPLADDGALQGSATLQLRELAFLELLSEHWVAPSGRLDGTLALAGTRRAPTLEAALQLAEFRAELPALGVTLERGTATLRSAAPQRARLEGSIASGRGTLRFDGDVDLRADAEETLRLTLSGEQVTAAATPELTAEVSPQLELRLLPQRVQLRGSVAVPLARVNLERLQRATAPSSDAVIVDAQASAEPDATLLDSDVEITLGDEVRLDGFGLKGKVGGKLRVLDRPGRATVARGGLQVSGEYKAYGQDLEITRGRLAYASTPLDDPSLDVRAQREVGEVKVGVQVRGTALAPELTLWSEPPLDQAEQLSYLVLGRPLRAASQSDGTQLTQAAAAFGGNLLAQKLGARMGLDEVGVEQSAALGGAALTVGKYLSPKLYVSYGVALFGPGQVVTFKYLLSRVWSVQIDSGSENRAALNYRLER